RTPRAGSAGPTPAVARRRARTGADRPGGWTPDRTPLRLPVGVRRAATMTASVMGISSVERLFEEFVCSASHIDQNRSRWTGKSFRGAVTHALRPETHTIGR